MFDLFIVPLLLQVVIPVGLLAWLAFGRDTSRGAWLVKAFAAGSYLVAVALAGLWLIVPPLLLGLYVVVFPIILVKSLARARVRGWQPPTALAWFDFAFRSMVATVCFALLLMALRGRRAPNVDVVDLAFPLGSGMYVVVNGGSTDLVNAHVMTLTGERFRSYRGQSYGVDVVRVGRLGLRASGFLPSDPAAYRIFGDPVYAPCAGRVVAAVDGVKDQSPPRMDRAHMAGNHVILDCGGVWIVLGHLREGSVCVRTADAIVAGDLLGNVGNTGNTAEPHLHIHAQQPGTEAAPFGGEPLIVRFDGRYLARNDFVQRHR